MYNQQIPCNPIHIQYMIHWIWILFYLKQCITIYFKRIKSCTIMFLNIFLEWVTQAVYNRCCACHCDKINLLSDIWVPTIKFKKSTNWLLLVIMMAHLNISQMNSTVNNFIQNIKMFYGSESLIILLVFFFLQKFLVKMLTIFQTIMAILSSNTS